MSDVVDAAAGQPTAETSAPAAPVAAPVSLSPSDQAVADNDFAKFERLEREKLAKPDKPASGPKSAETPAPALDTKPAPDPAKPATGPKPADRRADERARQIAADAAAQATAAANAEIARLRALLPAELRDARPAPPAPRQATLEDTLRSPDVSKPPLTEAQFYERHPDADGGDLAAYRAQYVVSANRERERREQADEAREAQYRTALDTFGKRLNDAKKDPSYTFDESLLELRTSRAQDEFNKRTLALLDRGLISPEDPSLRDLQRIGPDHVIADQIVFSEVAPKVLKYLSEHPDELAAMRRWSDKPGRIVAAIGRIEGRFLGSPSPAAASPAAPTPKTVTDAPPPPASLGTRPNVPSDPEQAAVAKGDYLAFEALERQKLLARGIRK